MAAFVVQTCTCTAQLHFDLIAPVPCSRSLLAGSCWICYILWNISWQLHGFFYCYSFIEILTEYLYLDVSWIQLNQFVVSLVITSILPSHLPCWTSKRTCPCDSKPRKVWIPSATCNSASAAGFHKPLLFCCVDARYRISYDDVLYFHVHYFISVYFPCWPAFDSFIILFAASMGLSGDFFWPACIPYISQPEEAS